MPTARSASSNCYCNSKGTRRWSVPSVAVLLLWMAMTLAPSVFFINRLIGVYDILKKAKSNEITCQNCSEAKATFFCHTCRFVCAGCTNDHKKKKVYEGHKTLPISEMRGGALIQPPMKNPSTSTCKKHKEEMKLYCFECEQLICQDCSLVDHAGHNSTSWVM